VSTFVAVGNATQSFGRMLNAVSALLPRLPQPVIVQHGNTSFQGDGCIPRPFIEMTEYNRCITEAGLVILHAGAGSVIHAIRAGKVPVVIPRLANHGEHVDDHQLEFARALSRAGKIVLAEEPRDLFSAVAEALRRKPEFPTLYQVPPLVGLVRTVLREYAEMMEE